MQKKVEGKLFFVRNELTAKRLTNLKYDSTATISFELILSCKKWCIVFAYRHLKLYKRVFFKTFKTNMKTFKLKDV